MARHLVHSLILTAVLSPLVSAGPCHPSSNSTIAVTAVTSQSLVTDSAATSIVESTTELSSSLAATIVTESETTKDSAATTTEDSTQVESLPTLLTTTITESETTGSATSFEAITTTTSCSTAPFPWEISSSFIGITTTTSEDATTTTTEAAATTTAEEAYDCEKEVPD